MTRPGVVAGRLLHALRWRGRANFSLDVAARLIDFGSPMIESNAPVAHQHAFEIELEVRDYECDLQGVVNNANYLHYLEHARHKFLKSVGLDFADYTRRGIHLVVVRAEVDYKSPLRSGDRFVVTLSPIRASRIRFGFLQNVYRLPNRDIVIAARIVAVALDPQRRPFWPQEFEALIGANGSFNSPT